MAQGLHPTDLQVEQDPAKLVKTLYEDAADYYEGAFAAIDDEFAFGLELDHYVDQTQNSRDRRRPQVRTLELFSVLRQKTAQVSESAVNIECLPVDQYADAEACEDAQFLLEHVIFDPTKRYEVRRREMIMGAHAARAWGMTVEFDARQGKWGDLVFRLVDPVDCFIAPGWTDPHDPTCPWWGERLRMRKQDVDAMIQSGEWRPFADTDLPADGTGIRPRGARNDRSQVPGHVNLQNRTPGAAGSSSQDTITVLKWWFRFSDDTVQESSTLSLPPEEQYLQCPACGHQDMADGEGQRDVNGGPPMFGEDCPECGGAPMERIEEIQEQEVYLKYPKGRLVIVALETEHVLYDDEWPYPLRSFPLFFYRPYVNPRALHPQSDTSLNWSLQVVSNAIYRLGYEQMAANRDIILTPLNGLIDSNGRPFQFTDAPHQIAYFKDPLSAQHTTHFQGSGLPAAWGVFRQAIDGAFSRFVGTSDMGLTPESSKNIPVGTIQQLTEISNIPVRDHIHALQLDEGLFLGVVLDMIIATWNEERWVRTIGMDGAFRMIRLAGSSIPNVDVMVTSRPDLGRLRMEELQAFQAWLQMEPPARRVFARAVNLPPSLVRAYENDLMQYASQMAPDEQAGGPEESPDGVSPGQKNGSLPPAIADRMASVGGR